MLGLNEPTTSGIFYGPQSLERELLCLQSRTQVPLFAYGACLQQGPILAYIEKLERCYIGHS